MSKNVAVFVDVANIFYAAKAAGVDIDYVTLLKASSAGRDLVRAYAYTGLDPENENQRNFHDFLRRHGYKVVSKDIRKYGDGKVKANLDIELVVDMMKTARNLDIAIVVSGDGDFAPAIRAVQEMGVRVEVVSFRGNTSSDLIDVADIFTDITQIAKVEKGSGRSGRRVADDDEDLSMTEVPDKMTEGSGDGRRRGRGGRTRTEAAASPRGTRRTSSRSAEGRASRVADPDRDAEDVRDEAPGDGMLVALPGEKLSRAARPAAGASGGEAPSELDDEDLEAELDEAATGPAGDAEGEGADGDLPHRRRRRRGGRGRGRGRGRGEGTEASADQAADGDEADDLDAPPPTPRRAASTFGSVWDSQLGVPAAATGAAARRSPAVEDEEDLEEPAVPEYLLAERRQRDAARGGRGRGVGRGRGGAYAAAMERERFGGGRGTTPSRFAEPAPRREGRDFREPRSGQGRGAGRSFDRPERVESRSSGGDPWSEVPPEIEAMLRAQLAASGGRPAREQRPAPAPRVRTDAPVVNATQAASDAAAPKPRATARRSSRVAASTAEPGVEAGTAAKAAAPSRRRRTTTAADAGTGADAGAADGVTATTEAAAKPRRRPAKPATAAAEAGEAAAAPKPRTTRRKADTSS